MKYSEQSTVRNEDMHIGRSEVRKPSIWRWVGRAILQPLLRVGNLDTRSARWRLDRLGARHVEISAVISSDDEPGRPNERLLDLVPSLVNRARKITIPLLEERGAPSFVHVWPGEPHRLLAALVDELRPQRVVEIGTYLGRGTLAMHSRLLDHGRLTTIDIVPWDQFPGTSLRVSDFSDGSLVQLVFNPGQPQAANEHAALFQEADLIYIDAEKDGVLERKILDNFHSIGLKTGTLLVFDDIRLWNMLGIWREIKFPKLDLTSFGHWTGTGLVEWNGKAAL